MGRIFGKETDFSIWQAIVEQESLKAIGKNHLSLRLSRKAKIRYY